MADVVSKNYISFTHLHWKYRIKHQMKANAARKSAGCVMHFLSKEEKICISANLNSW